MDNPVTIIVLTVSIFIDMLKFLVIFDVILSWLTLVGLKFRPKFLADIIDPVYKGIRSIIPTSFGPVDFTPIIVILGLGFLGNLLLMSFPEVSSIVISL